VAPHAAGADGYALAVAQSPLPVPAQAVDPGTPISSLPDEPAKELLFRRRVSLIQATRELWQYRGLAATLAERDLRVRYKQAVLGIAWALVTPLLLMGAFGLVFNRFANVNTGGVPYAIFAAVGLVPWSFFSTAFSRGGTSLVTNIPLLNKLYCPREVFPLASVMLAIADAVAATVILAALFPLLGFAPHWEAIYAPLLLLICLFFTVGVTLVASATVVYLRDLQVLLPLIVQFGLFVTPVGYSTQSIVESSTGQIVYAALNPLVPVINGLRRTILFGVPPELTPTLVGGGSSLVVLFVGFALFKRMEAGLADIA
jgi:ABC-type polysaccharide/polyol phosphate export permease